MQEQIEELNEGMQTPEPINEQYYTNINELIAERELPSKAQIFLSSLYNLSLYLFKKKNNDKIQQQEQVSFDGYLLSVGDQMNRYENIHKRSKQILQKVANFEGGPKQSELIECFRRVPYIFFQQNFVLDFGDLSKQNRDARQKQQKLNQDLDLVQINLFTQIHYKFHDYFAVVNNFDYLGQSILINIQKIQQSRKRMNKVKQQFVEKSSLLRKKIVQRQNLQKTIKMLKIAKSLKKLPTIINQILTSSLPYQCLSLLKSTKQSLTQVQGLNSLSKTSNLINQSQNLVQMGLNKRYVDQLYLYLQQCQQISLQESWQRINSQNCVDISGINSSMMNSSTILEQSFLDMQPNCTKNKRNEGKQYEIAMIVLQSYKYIDFPQDLTRIKISNSLRIYLKKFDQQLAKCLKQILQNKMKNLNISSSILKNQEQEEEQKLDEQNSKPKEQEYILNDELVEKVTVVFYVKHIYFMNEIMKETLNRLLGFLQTLLAQYQQSEDKYQQRFLAFFKQQLTSFSAISKIALQKIKSLMQLKNISGIGLQQFKQWIGLLEYWEKYADNLIDEHPLINYQGDNTHIQNVINQSLRKTINIMNIRSTVNQLSYNFVTSYHSNVVGSELISSLIDQSWQSVQIPAGFLQILNNISSWNDSNLSQNISITILNDSGELNTSKNKSMSMSMSMSQDMGRKPTTKFRILKNNILVDGNRYKVSVSFLLLCQFIDEYIKMAKSLNCSKFIYERMFDLIQNYNNKTKQLILEAQARKYQKMKNKNISAKHLCLVHNCLTLLQKILNQMKKPDLNQLRDISVTTIQIHRKKIIQKLESLLRGKIQSTINNFLSNKDQKVTQVNHTILNTLVQMMGIVDEYLQFDDRKLIFASSIDSFIKKYFKELLLKGKQLVNQNKILLQKLIFLKQYFPQQLDLMDRQLSKIQKS